MKYNPDKDITYEDCNDGISLIFEGYAGEFDFPDVPLVYGSFQQYDHEEPLNITQRTFEAHHVTAVGSGNSLSEALEDFEQGARFPWPSLKPRFTVAWRKKPQIKFDRDVETDEPIFSIAARYALILDYEPFIRSDK